MVTDILLLGGIVSPLLYVITTIVGGALRPGYSHTKDTVSELFSPGSPNKQLLNKLILPYALLTILFGIGMWLFVSGVDQANTLGFLSSAFMVIIGILNLLTGFVFLQDPMGQKMTFSGKMHIGLVSIMAALSMTIPILFGVWLVNTEISVAFGIYSLVSSGLIFVLGLSNLIVTKLKKPILGLMERLTIAVFLQWSVVIAIKLLTL